MPTLSGPAGIHAGYFLYCIIGKENCKGILRLPSQKLPGSLGIVNLTILRNEHAVHAVRGIQKLHSLF